MLELMILISGALSGWFATALIDWGSFHSILGWLKYLIVKRFLSYEEEMLLKDYARDDSMSAKQIDEQINEEVYWYAAKRSKIVYLLQCPYCLGFWIFNLQFIIIIFRYDGIYFDQVYLVLNWIAGVSLLYFFLNFAKR